MGYKRKKNLDEKEELVIMITKFLVFFFASYGNNENIHIRTQRETSNMWTHLQTAAAVSLSRFFSYPPLVFNFTRYIVMISLCWRYLTYVVDDDVAADVWQRTIHSHFPWRHHCHLDRKGCRAIIEEKGQVLIPKKEIQSGNII
jgi:hypothetical protein